MVQNDDTLREEDALTTNRVGDFEDPFASTTPHGGSGRVDLAPRSVAPPDFEGRYRRERLLGEGGMGSVMLCRDRQIGRNVAMKVIRQEWSGDERTGARFIREARIQGQLEHPSVVPVYDLGVDPDGALYFSMKRVRGVTLEDIVEGLLAGHPDFEGEYSRRRLLGAFAQICLAIDFAHERKVLHRDLKPANVMLGHYGEVYLLDWGLAKVQGEAPSLDEIEALDGVEMSPAAQTRQGALLGTPGYMSPEQVDGKHDELGPPSDVYGLGALLFELLTLRPLHEGANMAQLIASTRDGADARTSVRAPERNVPPEIEAICIRATALDPKDRHRTARELHDDIDAFLGGERDLELRRQMAAAHAENAVEAAQNARGGSSEIQGRRTAMQELGRALALDPENQDAMTTLMALLSEPPSELPREVSAELEHSIRSQNRKTALNGAWVYGTLIAYLPLLVWSGIREPAWIVAFFSLAFVCGGLSIWTLRTRPTTPMIMIVMAISTFMFAMLTPLVGPLVLVPTLLVANAVAFICHLDRRNRVITMAWTSLAVLLPFGLELVGVVDPSYLFSEAGMLVTARAADLESAPTLLLLLVSSIAALITCGMSVSRTRDNLREAEKRLYLYAWHLREFVPGAIRSATDPTGARRSLLSIPR